MCTVTYIPLRDHRLITHSRDEKKRRAPATPPGLYRLGGRNVLFPRDGQAGGSWLAVNECGYAAVLLNGGFVKHIPDPPYRKSRGLVFLDIASAADPATAWEKTELTAIEPFTLLLFDRERLWECRWTGLEKVVLQPDPLRPHIWSSATLYEAPAAARRQAWFGEWLMQQEQPTQEAVIGFHLSGGQNDPHNGIRMNRNGELLTVSISGIRLTNGDGYLKYMDLQDDREFNKKIHFITGSVQQNDLDLSPGNSPGSSDPFAVLRGNTNQR